MKTHRSHFTPRFVVLAATASLMPLFAQVDGKPGVDATPADLRPPAERQPINPTASGAAKPVDLDPKIVQAEAVKEDEEVPKTDLTIGAIVAGSEDFTTLMGAIKAAGLTETLNGEGPFTVLAPNNAAFAALPEGVLSMLLKPENRVTLRTILTYHVLPQKLMAGEFVPGTLETVQGEPLTVVGEAESAVTIQGAKFGITDVAAKNGVIQVINQVLIPPSISIEEFSKTKPAP